VPDCKYGVYWSTEFIWPRDWRKRLQRHVLGFVPLENSQELRGALMRTDPLLNGRARHVRSSVLQAISPAITATIERPRNLEFRVGWNKW